MNFKVPFNVFDVILLVVAVVGILRGRKHGMSEEMINLIKWCLTVVTCAFTYEPFGRFLADTTSLTLLSCYLLAYVITASFILGVFSLMKHLLGGKLIGSDIFGGAEYYLGMGSGLIRFGCVTICFLALLNARYFSPLEVRAMEKFQDDVYGSNFFPTMHSAQATVFESSLSGPLIRQYLDFLLIRPTKVVNTQFKQKEYSFPQ